MIKALLGLLVLAAAAYGGLLLWFRINESRLLFHPETGPLAPPPAALKVEYQDVSFTTEDGVLLKARIIRPPSEAHQTQNAWVLYFHGAAGNVGTPGYNEAWAKFRDLGLGVLAVDYRGYGESAGTPSEQGFYKDATAAYVHLHHALGVPASHIIIYGYSLGTAVAIDLSTHVRAAGLVVEGALLSIPTRAAELYPYVPVQALARNRFASIDKIGRVAMPKLFVHASGDEAIPVSHGKRLFAAAHPPKRFHTVLGGHTTAYKVDPAFFAGIKAFVAELGLLRP